MKVILGCWRNGLPRAVGDPDAVLVNFVDNSVTRDGLMLVWRQKGGGTPVAFQVAAMVLASAGNLVSRTEYMEALYGDREDGGAEDSILDVALVRVRRDLKGLGFGIANRFGHGWILTDLRAQRRAA